jgi:hypothetical protein
MARVSAFLVVFALIGGPIANAVCLSTCESHLTTGSCREHTTELAIASGTGPCPALVADTPFLLEEGGPPIAAPPSFSVHLAVTNRSRRRGCSVSTRTIRLWPVVKCRRSYYACSPAFDPIATVCAHGRFSSASDRKVVAMKPFIRIALAAIAFFWRPRLLPRKLPRVC